MAELIGQRREQRAIYKRVKAKLRLPKHKPIVHVRPVVRH